MYKDDRILSLKAKDLNKGAIPIDVYENPTVMFDIIARTVADEIISNNSLQRKSLFVMPLGPSSQYAPMAEMINQEKISLHQVTFINMDEYMWDEKTLIDENHHLSFRGAMNKLFYDKIDEDLIMPASNRIFPSLTNGKHIENIILQHGGIDLLIGGIGINGHVAFNEPVTDETPMETYKNRSIRVVKISPETIITNGINEFDGAYEFIPGYGITIGFKEILSAKKIRLYCFRNWHKMVVRKASFYPPSVTFPVTLLQGTDTRIGIPAYLAE